MSVTYKMMDGEFVCATEGNTPPPEGCIVRLVRRRLPLGDITELYSVQEVGLDIIINDGEPGIASKDFGWIVKVMQHIEL